MTAPVRTEKTTRTGAQGRDDRLDDRQVGGAAGRSAGLRRSLRRFRPYLRPQRGLLAAGVVAMVLEIGLRLLEPWPLKWVLDALVAEAGGDIGVAAPDDLTRTVLLAGVALLLVVGARASAAYSATVCLALAGNRVLTTVRADLFAHLQRLSMRFHDRARTGDLVTRVTGDISRLQEVAVTAAMPLVVNTLTVVGMLVVIAVMDWQLALVLVLLVPVFGLLGRSSGRRIQKVARTQRRAEGALAAVATEVLGAMPVVKTYRLEQRTQERFASSSEKSLKDGVKGARLSAGLERRTDVLVGIATVVVLVLGAHRVVAGALTPGELVVFLTYLKTAFKPLRDVAKYTARLAKASACAERVVDVLETAPEVHDAPGARTLRRARGDLSLDAVWLSYEPGHPVLRGVDLRVLPGQRVALVGPSGSGKSSITSLLTRLRDPDSGTVRVDGHDVRELTLASLRAQVAVVLQDSVLFAGTVRENIADGRPGADDAALEQAARVAGAHEFVLALPDGYDTVVGERGATLSGGQRQRIAIARAALSDAPVVVLDEAMTGLDGATEAAVVAALDRLTAGRTTVVVTHDLAAVHDCDRVFWIDGGVVVDSGPPAAVLARQGVPGAPR